MCLVGGWNPAAGRDGFSAGRCLTSTHSTTSRVAKTTDFPGTMSPFSPPSPMTTGLLAGGSLISPSSSKGLASSSAKRKIISIFSTALISLDIKSSIVVLHNVIKRENDDAVKIKN